MPVQAQTLGHYIFACGPVPPDILAHECEHIRQWSGSGRYTCPPTSDRRPLALLRGRPALLGQPVRGRRAEPGASAKRPARRDAVETLTRSSAATATLGATPAERFAMATTSRSRSTARDPLRAGGVLGGGAALPDAGAARTASRLGRVGAGSRASPRSTGTTQPAIEDPDGEGPRLYFQKVPEGKVAKNRVHIDLNVSGGRGVPIEERKR